MPLEHKADLHLGVAHVLFMDVVGFSKLLINDQSEILEQLNLLVRETPHFREAEAACGGSFARSRIATPFTFLLSESRRV